MCFKMHGEVLRGLIEGRVEVGLDGVAVVVEGGCGYSICKDVAGKYINLLCSCGSYGLLS
jgi:hypothetical protein